MIRTSKLKKFAELFIVSIALLYAVSCSRQKDFHGEKLFEVTNNNIVDYQDLIDQGYERVRGVDVLLFQKNNGDTIIGLQYGERVDQLYSKNWEFIVPSTKREFLKEFFENKGAFIISLNSKFDTSEDFSFTVQEAKTNLIFPCYVTYDDGRIHLNIYYYYPDL